ncbi:DUF4974 domain-containing protein [Chitinophaga horti]|uniref:DUF4974 domain-containing protein n=1 Tax=Chitinophaga horti TaxID=2920382 RepID=A0ABY6J436_9BACT|nr:FecR domain-containing protein [Chitinophaga horti]UYQ94433.1 DUF4974 domain-containing protein [Chitinophaga horti]
MDNTRLKELLSKYQEGTATAAEMREIDEWYQSLDAQPALTSQLDGEERVALEQLLLLRITRNIEAAEPMRVVKRPARYWWAAAVVLLLGAGGWWMTRDKTTSPTPVLATLEAGKNSIKKIVLPDSTAVWLNFDSKITYSATGREVWLEGEGYFDVASAKAQPFLVHAGGLEVKVLGTSFNIDAYTPSDKVTVTVANGKVAIGNDNVTATALTAGQQAIYLPKNASLVTVLVDAADFAAWRQGQLVFREMKFRDIALRLERRYDAHIRFEDNEVSEALLTGSFDDKVSLSKVMDMLCDIHGYKYRKTPGKNEYLVFRERKK